MEEYLKSELDSLRDIYITSTPRQRRNIIEQRVSNPNALPNMLVTSVGAVEALARTLVMHSHASTKQELREIYSKYRFKKTENLIREYLRVNDLPPAPETFGVDSWKIFRLAVEYRNLLIHECTYIGAVKYNPLVDAVHHVLDTLTKLAKIRVKK